MRWKLWTTEYLVLAVFSPYAELSGMQIKVILLYWVALLFEPLTSIFTIRVNKWRKIEWSNNIVS